MSDDMILLLGYFLLILGCFTLAAAVATWLEQHPYSAIAALLHKLFRYFGN